MTELTRSQSNAKAGGKGQACERLWEARPWIERSRGRPESKDAAWTHFGKVLQSMETNANRKP